MTDLFYIILCVPVLVWIHVSRLDLSRSPEINAVTEFKL